MAQSGMVEDPPSGSRSGRRRFALRFVGAIVAVMAPLILACGATPVLLKTAPANQLRLSLSFVYDPLPSTESFPPDKVLVTAQFATTQQGGGVLAGGQDLVCDGVDILKPATATSFGDGEALLDRQPPGGKYTCVYTDERGNQTTAIIPVPTGQLAITSPRAGARVSIPPPVPKPTPVTPLPTSGLAPPRKIHEPLTVTYAMPEVPPGGHATVAVTVGCPTNPGQMVCDTVYGPERPASDGVYVFDDPRPPISSGFDYLYPGPGYVTLGLAMDWSPASQGFQVVHVEMRDQVTNPITWTMSPS